MREVRVVKITLVIRPLLVTRRVNGVVTPDGVSKVRVVLIEVSATIPVRAQDFTVSVSVRDHASLQVALHSSPPVREMGAFEGVSLALVGVVTWLVVDGRVVGSNPILTIFLSVAKIRLGVSIVVSHF